MYHQRAQHRGQQNAAKKTAVQVADDLFQHKRRGRQRRIECGRQARCGPSRRAGSPVLFCLADESGKIRRDRAGQLHARPLAAQAGAATDADNARGKLNPRHAPGNRPEILPERQFELRDAAACRFAAK